MAEQVSPLYPFGHGLSYTQFDYDNLTISRAVASVGESVEVSMTVANCGQFAGDEVVQLYTRDEYASIPRPIKELKGYKRVHLLPGECKKITFHLPVDQLAFYDQNLDLVVEPGMIKVMVGSSAEDIRLTTTFEIAGEDKSSIPERIFFCPVEVA